MKRLTSLIIIAILSVICCFSFAGCNKSEYTYWQTNGEEASDGSRLTYVSELKFSSSKVSQVWINVDSIKPDQTTIVVELKISTATNKKINKSLTKNDVKNAKKNDGWINIYSGDPITTSNKAIVMVTDELRFNEIYIVNDKNESVKPEFSGGGVKVGTSSENIWTKEQIDNMKKGDFGYNANPAYNIVDEQDKFPTDLLGSND